MHKTDKNGMLIESACDYCARAWDPAGTEIMVEGHQGSLLCMKCLSAAYAAVVLHGAGEEHKGKACRMCLEERSQPQWESPVAEGTLICLRCIRQAATALEKDEEVGWKRPGKPGAPGPADDDED